MSGSNSPTNIISNSPSGDTGLNFVLQNAVPRHHQGGGGSSQEQQEQQFTGLATLNKLLQQNSSDQQQQQARQSNQQSPVNQQQQEEEEEQQHSPTGNDDDNNNNKDEGDDETASPNNDDDSNMTKNHSTTASPPFMNENNHASGTSGEVEKEGTVSSVTRTEDAADEAESISITASPSSFEVHQKEHHQLHRQTVETPPSTANDEESATTTATATTTVSTNANVNVNNNNALINDQVARLNVGTGSFDNGHFHFQSSRAATGEALHRVFTFSNRTAPNTNILVPQIAPQLAQGGNRTASARRKRTRDGDDGSNNNAADGNGSSATSSSSPGNKKLEKLVQFQREQEEKYKLYTGSSEGGLDQHYHRGAGGKDESGDGFYSGYRPYSLRSPLGAHHQHMSLLTSNNINLSSSPTAASTTGANGERGTSPSSRHHNFVGFGRDLFGLHCLFDACKDLISEKPKKLPKLRLSGVQREVDDISAGMSSSGAAATTTTENNNSNQITTASDGVSSIPPHTVANASLAQIQKQKRILHHHVLSNQFQNSRDVLISWLTPWPFEIEATADKNTTSKFNQQQMDRFHPISPIFTEMPISHDSIAHQIVVSARAAAYEEEKQRNVALQQQAAAEEARRLAQALSEQNDQHEKQRENDDGIDGDDNNNDKQRHNQNQSTETAVTSTSPGAAAPSPAKSNHNSNNKGFLPRSFQVASIPSVLPSLLTVTSSRHPQGISQNNNNSSSNNGKKNASENVDWSSPNSTLQQQQHHQQPHPPPGSSRQLTSVVLGNTTNSPKSNDPHDSARMRNRAKLWSTTLSSVGMLIPSELTHSSKFEKHKDVKRLESKTDRLKSELEHFKTMRSIRSGSSSTAMATNHQYHHDDGSQPQQRHLQPSTTGRQNKFGTSSSSASTPRGTFSSSSANAATEHRPKTPPKSFLATHGLRSSGRGVGGGGGGGGNDGNLHLPPIHHQNASGGGDSTGMIHPPVPWSRKIATGSSNLSARFTAGKYEKPERANLVAALMD